jgi:hypothetical protein
LPHFDDDQEVRGGADEIELAATAAKIALDDVQALCFDMTGCEALCQESAPMSRVDLLFHERSLRAAVPRCRRANPAGFC